MKKIIVAMIVLCAVAIAGTPAFAQQTTGTITGRILDAQGSAIPGVTVSGRNPRVCVGWRICRSVPTRKRSASR